jgi:hypothetical protein
MTKSLFKSFQFSILTKALILIFVLGNTNSSFSQVKSIILGRPTNTAVTASILFDQNVQYFLEYGTVSGNYLTSTSTFSNVLNVPDEVDLSNLVANTKYYYRMQYKLVGASTFTTTPEYSFNTQRSSGSSYTFTVESDEHLYDIKGNRSMYQVTLANEAADNPDFMLSLGDIFGDDHTPLTTTSADMDALHKDYRQYLGQICHSIPFYVCLGNHEGENDYYLNQTPPNNIAVWGTQWRKYYYPNPYPNSFYTGNTAVENYGINTPENYYSWTWGDALFVVLDVYRTEISPGSSPANPAKPTNWDWTLGRTQYDWMRSVLENSTAAHKFVFAHHTRGQGRGGIATATQFEWGGIDGNQNKFNQYRPGWGKPIHQVFVDTGVDIFFQGHDHLFAKEQLDGVVYQEVPMPSDISYTIGYTANAGAYPNGNAMDGTGHIRVNVTPTCVNVDYVKAFIPGTTGSMGHINREVAFSYSVGSCAMGLNDIKPEDLIKVYPNPANSKLNIQFNDFTTNHHCKLLNMIGQSILEFDSNEINTSNIPNGIYFLKIDSIKNYTKKIIIQH